MPELPYVERTRLKVKERCLNKLIVDVTVVEDKIVYHQITASSFAQKMKGRKIVDAFRRGKYFWFEMDNGPSPLFHLGMTGSLKYLEDYKNKNVEKSSEMEESEDEEEKEKEETPKSLDWPPPYWKFIFKFDDGNEVAFINKRRLGRIYLMEDPLSRPPISKLGFDPLVNMPTFDTFYSMVSKRSTQIKALLLNQSFSAGVGNWIADEILYQSQVHPQRYTSTLSKEEVNRIWKNTKGVIDIAVKANNNHSQFPPDWLFHYRWSKRESNKETPKTSKGEKISFVTSGGRTSAIVATIQILDEESIRKLKEIEKRKKLKNKNKKKKVSKVKKEDTSSSEEIKKRKKRKKADVSSEESEEEEKRKKKKKKKEDSSESEEENKRKKKKKTDDSSGSEEKRKKKKKESETKSKELKKTPRPKKSKPKEDTESSTSEEIKKKQKKDHQQPTTNKKRSKSKQISKPKKRQSDLSSEDSNDH
uniref:Formamidopyrimidine-DNA glycosylase catalytic domain-containing protein n=1 Tax=Arcella intermedia TaxID=1963864 RepID=A0A6B2L371_9EUKA|eukprot:TRINITY_DN20153_c0_g1_i1.p1 TRINITY_DN20153_c0_g1~~TRINITY_DN20153_c0_g1_i1.p1  ORF type:complete len:475 (+),score=201.12 TRINITY_DN20153_c0_g1_i1:19-1443(+)